MKFFSPWDQNQFALQMYKGKSGDGRGDADVKLFKNMYIYIYIYTLYTLSHSLGIDAM